MRTRPSESNVAVWPKRAVAIDPVALKAPVLGSYNSAEASAPLSSFPPAIRTRPSESSVAVWESRAVAIDPVELKAPEVGSEVGFVSLGRVGPEVEFVSLGDFVALDRV